MNLDPGVRCMNTPAVYAIINVVDYKMYVGSSSVCAFKRIKTHKRALNRNSHYNKRLQADWNKYESKSFKFVLIERCDPSDCITREQYWIDYYDVCRKGYNRRLVADSNLGITWPEEVRLKMSQAAKRRILDPAERLRLREQSRKAASPEIRKKATETRKKNWKGHTQEAKDKIRKAVKGRKHTLESRMKMSQVQKSLSKPMTRERKDHLSVLMTGRKHTSDTKRKMSESQRRKLEEDPDYRLNRRKATIQRWLNPESRTKQSKAQFRRWSKEGEREKQSKRLKGKKRTEQQNQRSSEVRLGVSLSDAHKDSIVKSWADEEKRNNRMEGLRKAWLDPVKREARLKKLRDTRSTKSLREYDWDIILDGQIHLLEQVIDYDGRSDSFASLVKETSRQKGIEVRVAVRKSEVVIQAVRS